MVRGRGRGKSSGRNNPAIRVSMPTIPVPTIVSSQQGGTPTVQTSAQNTTPIISETSPVAPNQSNTIGQGPAQNTTPTISKTPPVAPNQSNSVGHSNTIPEGDSSSNHSRTRIFLTSAGLEPSKTCSSFISKSFRNDVDSNGINWKSVSNDVRDGYFGEFKAKAAVNYRNFISKIKGEGVRPGFVPEHVWKRWMELWRSDDCIKKSEINAKNRRGGHETAAGTHTVGSISMGEYRKRHAVEKG
ncbi:hypothetical protein KY285_026738 [Solanum tuberosum]|nr:hypothetical protein KY285_026738 [Solanum tuberosum]